MSEPRVLKIACPKCQQKLDISDLPPFSHIECPSCSGELIVPRPFGDLMLEEPLGDGHLASVYRALDLTLDREVAVKILAVALAGDGEAGHVFLQEGRAAAAVNHPNVVPIYSCGEEEGRPYLVMQFMPGSSIGTLVIPGRGARDVALCLRAAAAAARGLGAAFRRDILHCGITPGSVLLDLDGNAKVGDFGLTKVARNHADADAETQGWPDPAYVAPECLRSGTFDWRADIFGLGATLYFLLTGRSPAVGDTPGDVVRHRVAGMRPPQPAELRAGLSAEISDYVMRMMAPDPADRPGDYGALADRLQAMADVVKTADDRPVARTPIPKAGTLTADLRRRFRRMQMGRRDPLGTAVTVALVLAFALLLLLVLLRVRQLRTRSRAVLPARPGLCRVVRA